MFRLFVKVRASLHHNAAPLLLLVLFLAAWLPRISAVNAFVTPDERKWLNRSGNFYWALTHGDLDDTFQREHPGVTILWAGTLGFLEQFPDYAQQVSGAITDVELESWLTTATAHTPLELLVAGRRWVTLAIAAALAACFLPLRRLFGAGIAALAVLTMAWDPLHLGLSLELHPSGLVATLTALALASFLAWLYAGRARRYLVASGVAFGLALLTETPAAVLAPVAGLLTLVELLRTARSAGWQDLRRWAAWQPLAWLCAWGAVAAAIYVVLWPAMWVQPITVLTRMATQMDAYAELGHALPNYFLGKTTADPGLLFYPSVWFFRSTPFSRIGAFMALVWTIRQAWPLSNPERRRTAWALMAFALLYTLAVSLAAKKFERYGLPAFLALDITAVLGWLATVYALLWWLRRRFRRVLAPSRRLRSGKLQTAVFAAALVLFPHAMQAFAAFPYYLAYYNPLAGGSRVAQDVLMVGWGEGLDEVADWLNRQPNAESLRVVSWYGDGPLSYYLKSDEPVGDFQAMGLWFDYDYAVTYINQWQRGNPDPELLAYFAGQTPVFVARANGLEVARVYDLRGKQPPAFTHIYTDHTTVFGQTLHLAAYALNTQTALPGDILKPAVFLKPVQPIHRTYSVRLRLLDPTGRTVWQEQRPPAAMDTRSWPENEIRRDNYRIELPANLVPGLYTLDYTVFDPSTGLALSVEHQAGDPALPMAFPFAHIQVDAPQAQAVHVQWEPLAITELQHAAALSPGGDLLVNLALDLRPNAQPPGQFTDLKLSLRLIDAQGNTVAQQDKDVAPTLRWTLAVPTTAVPGAYKLAAVLYHGSTLAALPDAAGQLQSELSTFEVQN